MPTKIAEFSVISVSSPLSCPPLSPSPQHITAHTRSLSALLLPSIPWAPPRSSPPPIQYMCGLPALIVWRGGGRILPQPARLLGSRGGISSSPRKEMLYLYRARH